MMRRQDLEHSTRPFGEGSADLRHLLMRDAAVLAGEAPRGIEAEHGQLVVFIILSRREQRSQMPLETRERSSSRATMLNSGMSWLPGMTILAALIRSRKARAAVNS